MAEARAARDENAGGSAMWLGGVFVGCLAAQLLSYALWSRQGGTHIVWFPGAVLLGALLATPPRRWPGLVTAAFAGLLVACVGLFRLPLGDTVAVLGAALALTPAAAWALRHVRGDMPLLQDIRMLLVRGAIVVVALPIGSALLIGRVAPHTSYDGAVLGDGTNVALAHALGYVLYLPAWTSLRSPDASVRHAGRIPPVFVAAMACAIALLGVIWYTLGAHARLLPLLCLAPAPILVAACLRAQMAGSSAAMFVIVVMAAQLSVGGHGPFVAARLQDTTLAVQLWTLGATLCAIAISALVEQRQAGQRALDNARNHMRELAGRLIATQEQERARLARDLHDDINQRLAAASIDLSALRRRVPAAQAGDVGNVQAQVMALAEDLRLMSHQLHPGWLSHAGLQEALQALCTSTGRSGPPRIDLSVPPDAATLSGEVALCVYRIAQEGLRNALDHAGASRVTIAVAICADHATLHIADDGHGFDPARLPIHASGIGLISMNERARLLGGRFDLRSAPGKGVQLCVHLPLASP
ncbi:ATP-binding protein [Xanthomonas sp. NCPPB 2632]|uniref:sensor histidine kinase n=1 Tax=Xanthomonas sp. NCPPB 2632 TaxID=3240912 RepID=UPI00351747FD